LPLWIFFLHRSYSNKSNKIYFIIFAFFLEFIWNLQATAEINTKIKEIPPYPTDQRAPLVSGRGFFPCSATHGAACGGAPSAGQGPPAAAAGGVPRGGAPAAAPWDPRACSQAAWRSAPADPSGGATQRRRRRGSGRRRRGQAAAGWRGGSTSAAGRLRCARNGAEGRR